MYSTKPHLCDHRYKRCYAQSVCFRVHSDLSGFRTYSHCSHWLFCLQWERTSVPMRHHCPKDIKIHSFRMILKTRNQCWEWEKNTSRAKNAEKSGWSLLHFIPFGAASGAEKPYTFNDIMKKTTEILIQDTALAHSDVGPKSSATGSVSTDAIKYKHYC